MTYVDVVPQSKSVADDQRGAAAVAIFDPLSPIS
jgi:hypothetical protein